MKKFCMNRKDMTENYYFRFFKCGLSIEMTSELCFKNVRTVKLWDSGKTIPPECRRLMRMYSKQQLGLNEQWDGFYMQADRLVLPTGEELEAQQVLTAAAILEIAAKPEQEILTKIGRYLRAIKKIQLRIKE